MLVVIHDNLLLQILVVLCQLSCVLLDQPPVLPDEGLCQREPFTDGADLGFEGF